MAKARPTSILETQLPCFCRQKRIREREGGREGRREGGMDGGAGDVFTTVIEREKEGERGRQSR